jgi:hypothetical protein
VGEADIRANVVMFSIQSKSKCPNASHEAPAVLSSKREGRKPGIVRRKPNLEHMAEGNLPRYNAFGEKQLHSNSIPSIPSLTHGQSIATPSDVCSLRLDNENSQFPSKLLTVEKVSKLPELPEVRERQLSSSTSSLGSHCVAAETSIVCRKRANPAAGPGIRVVEKHKRPKIEAIPAAMSREKQDRPKWSLMRAARALLWPISNLR